MKTSIALGFTFLAAAFRTTAADCVHDAVNALVGAENGTTLYDCNSAFTLVAVEPATSNQTGLHERCTDPVTYSVKQTQIAQSGTWWDVWAQDSGCAYCALSSSTCNEGISWSDTSTESFNAGFDLSTKDTVLGLINGNGKFNFGYSWGHSFTSGGSWNCVINAGDVGRLYVQNQKGWADSQTRYMTSTRGCGGNSVSYDAWSGFQRSNWALSGDNTINHGCSTGGNAHC